MPSVQENTEAWSTTFLISVFNARAELLTNNFDKSKRFGIIKILVYANSLSNGCVLDDVTAITYNNLVQKGIAAIPELLHTPYHWGYQVITNDLYRPLSLVL